MKFKKICQEEVEWVNWTILYDRQDQELLTFYYKTKNRDIGPAVRVFANGPGDLGSILGRVIPKTLKMVLDTTLLNTQHYKVRFKGKVEQSWEWSSALPLHLGVVAIEKGAFGSPSTMVANFTYFFYKTKS